MVCELDSTKWLAGRTSHSGSSVRLTAVLTPVFVRGQKTCFSLCGSLLRRPFPAPLLSPLGSCRVWDPRYFPVWAGGAS